MEVLKRATRTPLRRGFRAPRQPNRLAYRFFAQETNNPAKLPESDSKHGPNVNQQEHVSEEAAKMAKIQGGEGPDLEQGTPIQEVVQEEKEQREQAPQVVKEEVKANKANPQPSTSTGGTRSFSTSARQRLPDLLSSLPSQTAIEPAILSALPMPNQQTSRVVTRAGTMTGHIFPLPDLATIPIKTNSRKESRNHERKRDDLPLIPQLTNLLMRDGKKSVAERNMNVILTTLRTLPAPTYSTTRPLLQGAPAATYLPLDPIAYLTLAVDSVSPLMRIRSQRGAAGGGVALQIPVPLALRQRRRTAFTWILEAVSKRQNRGSGRDMFALRVAQEIVAVVEGRSSVWEKRQAVHRLATAARTNVGWKTGFRR